VNSQAGLLASLSVEEQAKLLSETPPAVIAALNYSWEFWARPEQLLPAGAWTFWLILAGRGFGKTRTGAETVREWAKTNRFVNLIGATRDDARDIMIEGESGILEICPADERPVYKKHESKLVWPSGCTSLVFTADEPERLRGKQHEKLWADEMAAWRYPEAWDQAMFGLRLGDRPQAVITTTPRPTNAVKALLHDPHTHVTRGRTYDNRENLAPEFFSKLITKYEGTRLGRQELDAELLLDMPGALWQREAIDSLRVPADDKLRLERIVIAIDPAISSQENSNETGIVAVGKGPDGHGYTLEDASGIYTPQEWARAAAALYRKYDADAVVAEANQGGEMVEAVIRTVLPQARVRLVKASRGKFTRAEPVAALYEQKRVHHVGRLDRLEDQMCEFTPDFDRKMQGYSPDRVDALVWGFTELFPLLIVRDEPEPEWHDEDRGRSAVGGY
jgi:phage terminase large subunit-like protein